jgi:hypothetical protein
MAVSFSCKCPEGKKPVGKREWRVLQYRWGEIKDRYPRRISCPDRCGFQASRDAVLRRCPRCLAPWEGTR